MSKKLRLHQFLSKTGEFRKKEDVFSAIKKKSITVDKEVINNPDFQIKKNSSVCYYDKKLEIVKKPVYILLNKPVCFLSSKLSKKDIELHKKSVFSLIDLPEQLKQTLFCVGRLDEDTSGLLILTNDGKLSHKITSPVSNIKKTYCATLEKPLKKEDKALLEKGVDITLEENNILSIYKTKPCKIKVIDKTNVEIIVSEGKKREVRRIFESVGNKVLELKRVSIGKIKLDELNIKEGEYRIVDDLGV